MNRICLTQQRYLIAKLCFAVKCSEVQVTTVGEAFMPPLQQKRNVCGTFKQQATSKNYFMRFWTRDFILTKVMKIPASWMYCGIFKTHCEGKRSIQKP